MRLLPIHLTVERRTLSVERSILSLSLLLLLLVPAARAGVPAWRVQTSHSFGDFGGEPGDEGEFVYLVYSTSPPGDANNLISITFGTGSACGVYEASGPWGWSADIQTDRTVFSGNGNYIAPPNGSGCFYLYSRYLGAATGAARAESAANGPFPALTVTLPAPRPASLAAPAATAGPGDTNAVSLAVASPDAASFILQYKDCLTDTNWTDLARVAVTGAVTLAADTNAAPARFYRAVAP